MSVGFGFCWPDFCDRIGVKYILREFFFSIQQIILLSLFLWYEAFIDQQSVLLCSYISSQN